MTDDLELRKRIAAQAQAESATAATPGVQAFQFFLVPLIIMAVCVGVFLLVQFITVDPRAPEEWIGDIKSGSPNARNHATLQLAQALRRMEGEPDKTLTPQLIEIYRDSQNDEHELRGYLATCLGFLRDARACELLMEEAAKEQVIDTRAACIDALGTIRDPATVPFLVKLLDDSNPVVRKYAAFNAGAAAGESGKSSVVKALRKKLSDHVADVTWNAAFSLAYFLDDPSGTDILKNMLDREYLTDAVGSDANAQALISHAMIMACKGAVKLRDESFIPVLRKVADLESEPDMEIRSAARLAIQEIEAP